MAWKPDEQPDPSLAPEGTDRAETDAGHQPTSPHDDVVLDQGTLKDRGTISDPSKPEPSKDE